MELEFFFDYVSPYSYLAYKLLPNWLAEVPGIKIKYTPVLFAGLLNHWGQKGPAEIASKRNYVFTQCLRIATRHQLPFTLPKFHPFNPLSCLRLSLWETAGLLQIPIMDALWNAGWQQGRDLGNPDELYKILAQRDIPVKLLEKIQDPTSKNHLKTHTDRAIDLGVFGVPTFITPDRTLFWGLDSFMDLKLFLTGQEKLDPKYLQQILARKIGATR
jgi:2-hydroxychromene-2-carboxylate isomerase